MNSKIKNKRKNLIISILLIFTLIFCLSSFTLTAQAVEENARIIPVYDIYGDNYVGSDYLADVGLFKRGFLNPVFSETVNTQSSGVNNQFVNLTYQRFTDDFASFEGTINSSNYDILIIYEAELWQMVGGGNFIRASIKNNFMYFRNYDLNVTLEQLADYAFPNVPNNYLQAIPSLNVYYGTIENTRSTEFYPYAEDFITKVGQTWNSFLPNNLEILDFGNINLPPFGTNVRAVGGEITYKSPYIIEDSEIIAKGAYLWNEELENLENRFFISDESFEMNFLSNAIEYTGIYSNSSKLFYYNYNYDLSNDIVVYNNGWILDNYRLILFQENDIIDFQELYEEGNLDGEYFKNNVQYLAVANKIQGYTNSYKPPENVFENIIDGIGDFFEDVGNYIGNVFDNLGGFFGSFSETASNVVENIGSFFGNLINNPIPYTALGLIVIIIIFTIFFITRRN